jgi:hypothetical protein
MLNSLGTLNIKLKHSTDMCGIVGYIGNKEAFPILIGGLEKTRIPGIRFSRCCAAERQPGTVQKNGQGFRFGEFCSGRKIPAETLELDIPAGQPTANPAMQMHIRTSR